MKILIVSTYDHQGGAARAAYRLHKSLQSIGIKSQMLVTLKSSDDFTVTGIVPATKAQKAIAKLTSYIEKKTVLVYSKCDLTLFSPAMFSFSGLVRKINSSDADIVHLHWVAAGMIRIEDLARINKTVLWSLHDMWAFTGGCHYDGGCGQYVETCGACPALGSSKKNDLSTKIFKRKARVFQKMPHLSIIGLSNWIEECAKKSFLFKNKQTTCLPNPIDTKIFRPLDKKTAREIIGLPQHSRLVLFGAMSATRDKRKGFNELIDALSMIQAENVEFIVFGSSEPQGGPELKFLTHYLGILHDDISLRAIYSAADVMVVPSLQENLSNIIMEALACGTPVVGFGIGGNPDMIVHKINGYLARPFELQDLSEGIDWILNHPEPTTLARKAREKIVREFDFRVVAKKYLNTYKKVLNM
jgi:glycosyltransferase involved in cell wall biosynthesis